MILGDGQRWLPEGEDHFVDVNKAPREVLKGAFASILQGSKLEQFIDQLMMRREKKPLTTMQELKALPGVNNFVLRRTQVELGPRLVFADRRVAVENLSTLSPGQILERMKARQHNTVIEAKIQDREKLLPALYGFDLNREQVNEVFEKLGVQSGETVLEIGPGVGPFGLIAALRGAHVTVIEYFERFAVRQMRLSELYRDSIEAAGGSHTVIIGSALTEAVQSQIGDQKCDHVVLIDVINPSTAESTWLIEKTRHEANRTAARVSRTALVETLKESRFGIRETEQLIQLLSFIAQHKSPAKGSVFFNILNRDNPELDSGWWVTRFEEILAQAGVRVLLPGEMTWVSARTRVREAVVWKVVRV